MLRLNRAAFAAVGILASVLTFTAAILHRRTLNRAAFPLLSGSQAVLILSAFTAVGSPRYAMGMWPMIIAGVTLGALGLLRVTNPKETKMTNGPDGPDNELPGHANSLALWVGVAILIVGAVGFWAIGEWGGVNAAAETQIDDLSNSVDPELP